MSTVVLRKTKDPLELLERALNKTTLTTQRARHGHIIDIGNDVEKHVTDTQQSRLQCAVNLAVQEAEERAAREMHAALRRMRHNMNDEKRRALDKQKHYYETMADRLAKQRDALEEEKLKERTKLLQHDKEMSMRKQWEECQRIKQLAVTEACENLSRKMRNEFAFEKETAIAEALGQARDNFQDRQREAIERTKRECDRIAADERAKLEKQHRTEIDMLNQKYKSLQQKYFKDVQYIQKIEGDFKNLQEDYKRFLDYTDGQFHSDYLMVLRDHGQRIDTKKQAMAIHENVKSLNLRK
ncbi:unnamed protein product [Owenia fusiformis]|uniref:Uncharacterized protein n=1 Tax=Owenia fusiformis TaxID=6347 RepID=A0A8J1UZH6_OWEFU|nr:unnamed protein product [Owenia fusiformis]